MINVQTDLNVGVRMNRSSRNVRGTGRRKIRSGKGKVGPWNVVDENQLSRIRSPAETVF